MYDEANVKRNDSNIKPLVEELMSKVFSLPPKEHCLFFKEFKLATKDRLEKE